MQKKSLFLIVFTLLIIAFYAHQENVQQGQYLRSYIPNPQPISYSMDQNIQISDQIETKEQPPEVCPYQETANADNDNCPGNCADKTVGGTTTKQCCDYTKDTKGNLEKSCACKDNVNPASSDKICTYCMAYAEAGGVKIPNECMSAVMCTIKNRVNNPKHRPVVTSACAAVAQGDGTQFNPYKCVCNSNYPNQKYCKCVAGLLSGKEKEEADAAAANYDNLDCSTFPANSFNNAGMNSYASTHCKKVAPPAQMAACKTLDFYECDDTPKPAPGKTKTKRR